MQKLWNHSLPARKSLENISATPRRAFGNFSFDFEILEYGNVNSADSCLREKQEVLSPYFLGA
jgi:hypothetical protein